MTNPPVRPVRVLRLPWWFTAVWGSVDHGACLLLGRKFWAVRVGYGWDQDLPWSWLPGYRSKRLSETKWDWCVAWCGFYIGLTHRTPLNPKQD